MARHSVFPGHLANLQEAPGAVVGLHREGVAGAPEVVKCSVLGLDLALSARAL